MGQLQEPRLERRLKAEKIYRGLKEGARRKKGLWREVRREKL
jgi:hypothetical protein